jgi:hypothetical protein
MRLTAKLVIASTSGLEIERHPPKHIPHSCAQEGYGQKYACCECDLCPGLNWFVRAGLRIGMNNRARSKNTLIHNG